MRTLLIAGNWKMHGSREQCKALLTELKKLTAEHIGIDWVVFPPYLYLPLAQSILDQSNIAWGGQNLSSSVNDAALTGEVSGRMLKDFGASYVLVGHSERRQFYGETDDICAAKCVAALQAGLQPIFCLGETLAQRQSKKTFEIIKKQLAALLGLIDNHAALAEATFAYEPVWAIGTGESATSEQAEEVHSFIRQCIAEVDTGLSQSVRILYGGSVNSSNASALLAMPNVDGALVGGASLEAKQFVKIGSVCISSC